jgi:hypothetical protein
MMSTRGTFRIHFNRHGAAPLVCSVSTDEWELNVSGFESLVPMKSVYITKETPDDEDGKPSFWLEATGQLEVVGSMARFTP